ncbi:PEBP-like protein [Amniculicola lignicola CBS 123094]|uniref:Large ribosomal subunit protein mL38 n=1 Tax=Amniculicola lignicola CBS 123094 TaxID=1392246 RepID=A0A6A5WLA5_9PLEO|nr:PEBP-like protein [Amniculicola lignicola CBS 123094]
MASAQPSMRQFSACLRCVRPLSQSNGPLHASAARLLSTTAAPREEVQTQVTAAPAAPPPATASGKDFMKRWGKLNPELVESKRDERRLIRREGTQPVGSRRRRAALRRTEIRGTVSIPFEQLPYQCFQEARKFLLEDRKEKIKQIEVQSARLKNIITQDAAVSGGKQAKEVRIQSMKAHINELVILADINDPIVKKKFEDRLGDMNKPIYRYLANEKWRKYKRLVLEQRISQFSLVPDLLPAFDPIADVDLGFGRRDIAPGEFVDSCVSEQMPRLNVQTFEAGEKLVTVVVVDADVPDPKNDNFTFRCHFVASNIKISPTETSIPLIRIGQDDAKATDPTTKRIAVPWLSPWANKGAPYHRLAIFVLEQSEAKPLDISKVAQTQRNVFSLRGFVDRHHLKPIGASLFRTQWDESMPGVLKRAGLSDQINVEFKRTRIEPLPYKRRTERMR